MIWLSWRQFRTSALVGLIGSVTAALALYALGKRIRDARHAYLTQCADAAGCADALRRFAAEYMNPLLFVDAGILLVPAVLGMFWGAPLVARELENGTHRLVWNQSVTRSRWLAVKLAIPALAAAVVGAVLSGMLTWAARPVDQIAGDRFSTIVFGARDLAPVAYALFAFVLGAVAGLLIRRTVPAMAVTAVVDVVTQVFLANAVRPNLMPPLTETRPMTVAAINELRGLGGMTNRPSIRGLTVPDAWVTSTSDLRTPDGRTMDAAVFNDCIAPRPDGAAGSGGTFGAAADCLGALNLHVDIAYQPGTRPVAGPAQRVTPADLLDHGVS